MLSGCAKDYTYKATESCEDGTVSIGINQVFQHRRALLTQTGRNDLCKNRFDLGQCYWAAIGMRAS